MDYHELIERALCGRSIRRTAEEWNVPQATLNKYMRGDRTPDVATIRKIIKDAGVPADEALAVIEMQEQHQKDGGPPVSRTRHQRIMSPLL
jgi:transcriptional regulator with XRE-family HTH domain